MSLEYKKHLILIFAVLLMLMVIPMSFASDAGDVIASADDAVIAMSVDDVNDTVFLSDVSRDVLEDGTDFITAPTDSPESADESLIYVDGSVETSGNGTQSSPFKTVGEAIDKANTLNESTIHIASGTYTETGFSLTKNVTILGAGIDDVIIDANNQGRIFDITGANIIVTMNNLTLANVVESSTMNGGAIKINVAYPEGVYDNLYLDSVRFENITCKGSGGAIYNFGGYSTTRPSILEINNCEFINCRSSSSNGGAILTQSSTTITNSLFSGCRAAGNKPQGGAIMVSGTKSANTVTIEGCTFVDNAAEKGVIYTSASMITSLNIVNNSFVEEGIVVFANSVTTGGLTNIENNWWGNNNPDFTALLNEYVAAPDVFAQLDLSAEPTKIGIDSNSSIATKFIWNGTTTDATSSLPARSVVLTSNGNLTETEGNVGLTSEFTADDVGSYVVYATVDNQESNVTITVKTSSAPDFELTPTPDNVTSYVAGDSQSITVNYVKSDDYKAYANSATRYLYAEINGHVIEEWPYFHRSVNTFGSVTFDLSQIPSTYWVDGENTVNFYIDDDDFDSLGLTALYHPLVVNVTGATSGHTPTNFTVADSMELEVGEYKYVGVYDISPSDLGLVDCTFVSSNSSIVSVGNYGKITGVAPGVAVVTVSIGDGENYTITSKNVTVTVKGAPGPDFELTPTPDNVTSYVAGDSQSITVNYVKSDAYMANANSATRYLYAEINGHVIDEWPSWMKSVNTWPSVTFDLNQIPTNYWVDGENTVNFYIDETNFDVWGLTALYHPLVVNVTGATSGPTPTDFTVAETMELDVGGSKYLGVYDISPSDLGLVDCTFVSSNSSIVSVGNYGKITGVAPGVAVVTVSIGDGVNYTVTTKNVTVTVNAVPIDYTTTPNPSSVDYVKGTDCIINVTAEFDGSLEADVDVIKVYLDGDERTPIYVSEIDASSKKFSVNLKDFADKLTVGIHNITFHPPIGILEGVFYLDTFLFNNLTVNVTEAPAPVESIIYVSPAGSDDAGDGSESSPYATITKALTEVTDAKNQIIVLEGSYNTNTTYAITQSVSITAMGEVSLTKNNTKRNNGRLFEVSKGVEFNLTGVTIENISANGINGYIIYASTDSSDAGDAISVTIDNCTIRNNTGTTNSFVTAVRMIYAYYANLTVTNSNIVDNAATNLIYVGYGTWIMNYNNILNNNPYANLLTGLDYNGNINYNFWGTQEKPYVGERIPELNNWVVVDATIDNETIYKNYNYNLGFKFQVTSDGTNLSDLEESMPAISFDLVSDLGNALGDSTITMVDNEATTTYAAENIGSEVIDVTYGTSVANLTFDVLDSGLIHTEITVNTTSLELTVGENATINATLTPGDAGVLSFTSSDNNIVSVDADGKVTAIAEGNANITVSFAGNGTYAPAENVTIAVSVTNATKPYDGVIYVSPAGSDDAGDGSESSPYATITKALTEVTDERNEIIVLEGSYNTNTTYAITDSVSITARGNVVLTKNNTKRNNGRLFEVSKGVEFNLTGVTIENISANGINGYIIYASTDSSDAGDAIAVTIDNCTIRNNTGTTTSFVPTVRMIHAYYANLTVTNSNIADNSATNLIYVGYGTWIMNYNNILNNNPYANLLTGFNYNGNINYNFWGTQQRPDVGERIPDLNNWVIVDATIDNETIYEHYNYNLSFKFQVTADGTNLSDLEESMPAISFDLVSDLGNALGDSTITMIDNEATTTYAADNVGSEVIDVTYGTSVADLTFEVEGYDIVPANITANDITKYYHGPEQFIVNVTNSKGKAIPGQSVLITINGVTYNRTTDKNGLAHLNINLNSGVYIATTTVANLTAESNVTVLTTIDGEDIESEFRNITYKVFLLDFEGKYVENGTPVKCNINGKFYTGKVIGDEGEAYVDLVLNSGMYIITATNPVTGENQANNIVINAKIPNINVTAPEITEGENATVTVTLPEDATGNVTIGNENVPIENGVASAVLTDLPVGSTTVPVTFPGDSIYDSIRTEVTITVNEKPLPKENLTIEASADAITVGENATVVVTGFENATGNVTVAAEEGIYTAPIVNGTATVTVPGLVKNITASVTYGGDDKYNNASTTVDIVVNPKPRENATISIDAPEVTEGENATVTVTLPEDATGNVTVGNETVPVENGTVTVIISDLPVGNSTLLVIYSGDDKYNPIETEVNVTVKEDTSDIITAPDVTKYYNGSERFVVTVTDYEGNPIANKTVKININSVEYTRTTNESGIASMALGLNSGVYNVTTTVDNKTIDSVVTILSTVNGTDVVKVFRNGTQYYATFKDSEGNYLVDGTKVQFNINGVFYERYVSGNIGLSRLNLNLEQGTYILTAMNPVTGENCANNITILPRLIENNDVTKYYRNATQYTVKVIGDDGKAVGAGETVIFNINGVFYERTTNESGIAKININLQPGDYVITAEYKECRVSNNITVLPVLSASDLTKTYGAPDQFVATLLDGQGKPFANEKIEFNINGVFYYKTTDSEGHAKLNINLMPGEYIITSSYNGTNVANTVKVNA